MERNEAITYLKELLSLCEELSPTSVSFENLKDSDSVGYRVRITGAIHESDRQMVRDVAKKHNLALQEDAGGVLVYKPR